jgi:hypothetical protein
VTLTAVGRDLLTDPDGSAIQLEGARVDARAEMTGELVSIRGVEGVEALVGTSALSGFRRRALAATATGGGAGSVARQLLDDLPIALMLSGRVLRTAGIGLGASGRRLPVDICAGWVDGGTLLRGFSEQGPPLVEGPRARPIGRGDDPEAWHPLGPPTPGSTRRHRRLDVRVDEGVVRAESWFRDSHCGDDGIERTVHEYLVSMLVDRSTGTVLACRAQPGHLPYPECPGAVASADRLVGRPASGLRSMVTAQLSGPSTCTHLNDALRALGDIDALLRYDRRVGTR